MDNFKNFFKGFSLKGISVDADVKTPWNEDVSLSVSTGSKKPKPKLKKLQPQKVVKPTKLQPKDS